jgi:putative ABC transport system permease protein
MTSGGRRHRTGPARLVLKLAWRRMRSRPLRVALAAVAVAAGVASVSSVLVVRHSVSASVADARSAMAGIADLRIDSAVPRRALEPGMVEEAERVPGVDAVAPAVEAVTLADPPGDGDGTGPRRAATVLVLGADCRLADAAGFDVCLRRLMNEATGRPLAAGPDVPMGSLRVSTGTMPLDDTPVIDELGEAGIGNLVILSLADAQQAFSRGDGIDSMYVTATAGTDPARLAQRLQEALGDGADVSPADEAPTSLEPALGHFLPVSGLVAVLALMLSGALVYTTLTMSLAESRRSMAIARALGASRRLVRVTHLVEAVVVGLAGGVAGAFVGALVARPMVESLSAAVSQVVNIQLAIHYPPGLWLVGAAIGLVTAAVAAVPVLRAAGHRDVVGGLSPTGDEVVGPPVAGPLAWALFGAVGVAAIVVAAQAGAVDGWALPVGVVGFGCLTLALVFGGAESVVIAGRPLTAGPLRRRPVASLVVVNLSRAPRRTAAVVTVVAATLVSSFVLGGFVAGSRSGVIERVAGPGDLSVHVSMAGTDVPDTLDVGLDPGIVDELAALPGVRSIRRDAPGSIDGHDVEVRTVVAGLGANMDPGVIVAQDVADHAAVGPAVPATVRGRAGDVRLLVSEVDPGADAGSVRVDRKSFLGAFGQEPMTSLEVEPMAGTSPDDLAAVIGTVEGAEGLRVRQADEFATDESARLYRLLEPYRVLQAWLLVLGLVTMSATLVLSGLQRRREIGLIRAVGLTRNGIGRLVVGEALFIWLISLVLSSVAGPVLLRAFLAIESLLVGTEDPFRPAWGGFSAYALVVLAMAALAAVWPAVGATRLSVVDALEEDA